MSKIAYLGYFFACLVLAVFYICPTCLARTTPTAMKNLSLTETAVRYGMQEASLGRLLAKIGWVLDGQVSETAVLNGYLTKDKEVDPLGIGFLDGYLRRR